MYLHALATAVPETTFTQEQCWELVKNSSVRERLHKRTMLILRTILRSDHGVATRHFAIPDIAGVFDRTADELNAAFRTEGPKLAARALSAALEKAAVKPAEIDALLICTCTGYLCPGLTSYVAELLGMRPNVSPGSRWSRLRRSDSRAARDECHSGRATRCDGCVCCPRDLFGRFLSRRRSRCHHQRVPV